MEYKARKVQVDDAPAILEVMNYYINNSMAAYFEQNLPLPAIQALVKAGNDYPFYVLTAPDDAVIGYGFLRRYHPASAFDRTAELAYFIMPEHTRQGLGQRLLNQLIEAGREMGISILLANINGLNQASIDFHRAHGFREVGRLEGIGRKFGQDFDVVWMQKNI